MKKNRIKREEAYKKKMEEEYFPKWEAELETLTKTYNKMKAESEERKEEWDSFANEYRCAKWWRMSNELKFNKGRKAMRRFVALMANKELRNKVFGF